MVYSLPAKWRGNTLLWCLSAFATFGELYSASAHPSTNYVKLSKLLAENINKYGGKGLLNQACKVNDILFGPAIFSIRTPLLPSLTANPDLFAFVVVNVDAQLADVFDHGFEVRIRDARQVELGAISKRDFLLAHDAGKQCA
jgi:hypothetical protein